MSTNAPSTAPAVICGRCLVSPGKLCDSCKRDVLPQLAINLGLLWLMGEARCEQTRLQNEATNAVAIAKAERRERRKANRRGLHGLIVHIATAA